MRTKTPCIGENYLDYEELDIEWEDRDIFSLNPDTDIELLCEIAINQKLSVKEIDKLISLTDELNKKWIYSIILIYQNDIPSSLDKYKEELDFDMLLSKSNKPNEFFYRFQDNIDLERSMWRYDFMPHIDFIKNFKDRLNESCWDYISTWAYDKEIIEQFKDCLNWDIISKENIYLIYDNLFSYINYINFDIISEHELPKEFIKKFKDKLNCTKLFLNSNDDDVIEMIKDNINWNKVSSEPISEDLIERFKDQLDWDEFSSNLVWFIGPHYDMDIIERYKDKINFNILLISIINMRKYGFKEKVKKIESYLMNLNI